LAHPQLQLGVRAHPTFLVRPTFGTHITSVAASIFDFSHLTPDERIELAEQLWDSLESTDIDPSEEEAAELRRRRAELEADGDPGEPWQQVLDEIAERGA